MPTKNHDRMGLVDLFREMTELTIIDEGGAQSFRARAYETATATIKTFRGDLGELSATELARLDGIGKSTAAKIREYFDKGSIAKLEGLRAKYPADFVALTRIPGLGPKTIKLLRAELGIETLADLRLALADNKLRHLKGLGAKTEEKLRRSVDRMEQKKSRRPIASILPLAETLVSALSHLDEVDNVRFCGSLRRFCETISDVDIVVATRKPERVMTFFVEMECVEDVLGHGATKSSIQTGEGIQVDLRTVTPEQFGAAVLYFTGSKSHNIALRQRALERNLTLNEYGLSELEGGAIVAAQTEEAIYSALDLDFIPAPMREDTGEVAAAANGSLPIATTANLIRGDLHVHTDASGDAKHSLSAMLDQAVSLGREYIAVTDHGQDLAVAGVKAVALRAQRAQIDGLRSTYPRLRIFHGCELNIDASGGLDYDATLRGELEFGLAGIHSHFDLDRDAQTRRMIAAIENPCVDAIAHLQGRIIGRRPGIDLDIDAVLGAAAASNTAIEVNSLLPRLDANHEVIRKGVEAGVIFIISSDAHSTPGLSRLHHGALLAQKGWLPPSQVANTWPLADFEAWLRRRREAC